MATSNSKLAKLLAKQQAQQRQIAKLNPDWHPPTKTGELAAAMDPDLPSENDRRAKEAKLRRKGIG